MNFTLDPDFDGSKKLKILIHGWKDSLHSNHNRMIKNAYLSEAEDFNIIVVDWSEMACDNNYFKSVAATRYVGRSVATLIKFMMTYHNVSASNIHLIGFSLGAHTSGFAGMYTRIFSGQKIGRITGLGKAFAIAIADSVS